MDKSRLKDIAIFGAGAVGREILILLRQINAIHLEWNILGFFDDHQPIGTKIHDCNVIGGMDSLNKWSEELHLLIAIGDCQPKMETVLKITNKNIKYPTIIHPSVQISDYQNIEIGEGSIICSGSILTCDIKIKCHVFINLGVTIGHDAVLEDYCSIMPGCHFSGFIKLESGVYLGTGSCLIRGVKVATKSVIGAGAVLIENVEETSTMVGVPARPVNKKIV